MERFVKTVNLSKPLTILAKRYTLDVWKDSEYAQGPYTNIFKSLPYTNIVQLKSVQGY